MEHDLSSLRTWMEIDLSAIRHNLGVIKKCAGEGKKAVLVVKANAYGLGAQAICSYLEDDDFIAYWGVANVAEARALEEIGTKKPIFLLGPTHPGEWKEIVENGWTFFVSDVDQLERIISDHAGHRKVNIHLAVNTGMGREGFLPECLLKFVISISPILKKLKESLNIEGLGSHMPSADEDPEFTKDQIARFDGICRQVEEYFPLKYKHLANSAGIIGWDSTEANMVRPGLMVYGHNPMGKDFPLDLRPTMKLKSRITFINVLPEDEGISYGRDYITKKPTRVATVGIGYADGYPRQLSNKGTEVAIQGVRCPILGRVTMDQIMVDVSDLPSVRDGEEVELFGDVISAEELAEKADTIVWDIFTGLGNRVTRVYKESEKSLSD